MNAREVVAPTTNAQEYAKEQRRAKILEGVVVPTADVDIRQHLQRLGLPPVISGEDRGQRRKRLQNAIADNLEVENSIKDTNPILSDSDSDVLSESEVAEEYWTEGNSQLLHSRCQISKEAGRFSCRRLKRAQRAYNASTGPKRAEILRSEGTRRRSANAAIAKLELQGVQSGFPRPVGSLRIFGGDLIAGDWSGQVSVLDLTTLEYRCCNNVHEGKACVSAFTGGILSGGVEGDVAISDFGLKGCKKFSGHTDRVTGVEAHPHLPYIASASHDRTWRFWDPESSSCLLTQEGHSRGLSRIKFHPDGSLVFTCGLDGIVRAWDLRTGSSIIVLKGHAREIYGMDVSKNGYEVVTGSADNTLRVWDLRTVGSKAVVPAHRSTVVDVQFADDFIVTASLEGTVRLWSVDDWKLRCTLKSQAKLLALEYNESRVWTGRWDRCVEVFM